ncbi:hypothetical protein E2C01_019696 [Portunus trituberculatus]|uniref:Uncharacterized protein n=1 Tax=Portunus trituberculatus TaxID=210409 RepID=A0A5B7E032_PORTR|nr:hypothetical protein [Portunus trituberculatus]
MSYTKVCIQLAPCSRPAHRHAGLVRHNVALGRRASAHHTTRRVVRGIAITRPAGRIPGRTFSKPAFETLSWREAGVSASGSRGHPFLPGLPPPNSLNSRP